MTAPGPLTVHEEIDFLDEIERELVALTTADLEDVAGRASSSENAQALTCTTGDQQQR
jgi:hypothetical protein